LVLLPLCFKPSKDRYKLRPLRTYLYSVVLFQTLKGSLQTARIVIDIPRVAFSFKPSKDRYKQSSNVSFSFRHSWVSNPQRIATNWVLALTVSLHFQFQTLKGSLQTVVKTLKAYVDMKFQTLKGSLQTVTTGTDSGATTVFQTLKGSLQTIVSWSMTTSWKGVSNPQRIATNIRLSQQYQKSFEVSNPQRIATNKWP